MIWRVLSHAVAVYHGLNVLWINFGVFFVWRRPVWRAVHLASVWIAFIILSQGLYCPMTKIENAFTAYYDPSKTYSTGFILRYFRPMVWWDMTQPQIVKAMSVLTLLVTVFYAWLWARENVRRKRPPV